jgi:hypothetical protein
MNKSAEDLGIGRQVRSRPGVDGPANDAAAEGVNHNAAIELALAGGVFGDVGDHSLSGPSRAEQAPHEIGGGDRDRHPLRPSAQWQAGQVGAAHQPGDGVVADHHALA